MDQISRLGVYGVLLRDSKVLLNRKRSGPYKDLWDFPGGAIEFGETPEEALKRELLEESAISMTQWEFSHISTAVGSYENASVPYEFHHIGMIYKVTSWMDRSDVLPEEENRWFELNHVNPEELTPFAKYVVSNLPKDKGWRPLKTIRGKVVGLVKHQNRLLVCEVLDDAGVLKGWCPLGGGIDFGESAESALKREFQEELGCDVKIMGEPMVWENIFEHHGIKGHEIIFGFPIQFTDTQIYLKNRFQIFEARGSAHWVEWINIERFKAGEFSLFPPALLEKVDSI